MRKHSLGLPRYNGDREAEFEQLLQDLAAAKARTDRAFSALAWFAVIAFAVMAAVWWAKA